MKFYWKMSRLGFTNQSRNWFESYRSSRFFRVNFQNKNSIITKFDCRVTQGSILGPVLYLLNVDDVNEAVGWELFPYLDDSCLVYQHEYVKEIEKDLNWKSVIGLLIISSALISQNKKHAVWHKI